MEKQRTAEELRCTPNDWWCTAEQLRCTPKEMRCIAKDWMCTQNGVLSDRTCDASDRTGVATGGIDCICTTIQAKRRGDIRGADVNGGSRSASERKLNSYKTSVHFKGSNIQ